MFRDKPDYNKKYKLNYKIDLVGVKSSEVFFIVIFHSTNLVETGIDRAFGYILGQKNTDDKAFVVDCNKKTVPKWIDIAQLTSSSCSEKLEKLPDINDMCLLARKIACERFSLSSGKRAICDG